MTGFDEWWQTTGSTKRKKMDAAKSAWDEATRRIHVRITTGPNLLDKERAHCAKTCIEIMARHEAMAGEVTDREELKYRLGAAAGAEDCAEALGWVHGRDTKSS
jgi:hypothetical protein